MPYIVYCVCELTYCDLRIVSRLGLGLPKIKKQKGDTAAHVLIYLWQAFISKVILLVLQFYEHRTSSYAYRQAIQTSGLPQLAHRSRSSPPTDIVSSPF
jgi:hypothetical protein